MRPTYGQNFSLKFRQYLDMDRKFNKTIIVPKEMPMGSYSIELFLVPSDPTYGQNIISKAFNHLEYFPRDLVLYYKSVRYLLDWSENFAEEILTQTYLF